MRLALRELRRRPRAFAAPAGILLLLSLLLLYPTAVLDGMWAASTGGLRHLPGELLVYRSDAHRSLFRSSIDATTRDRVADVPGVSSVRGFGALLLSGSVDGGGEAVALAVTFVDGPPGRAANDPEMRSGEAVADASLRASGVTEGSVLRIGPFQVPVTVTGFVDDASLLLVGGLRVAPDTWHRLLGPTTTDTTDTTGTAGSVGAAGPSGPRPQALVIGLAPGADVSSVALGIDRANVGGTDTVDIPAAIRALPGMAQQEATFGAIRAVTFGVALVVVALFLSFVTLERGPLYAVLKALGTSSGQLFGGVVAQAVTITVLAVLVAFALTSVLTSLVPTELPTLLHPRRLVEALIGLAASAALASALALRRVTSIDPASAIG